MYLIKNGIVHVGDGKVLEDYDILVEGKQIRKMGKNLTCEEAQIMDVSGCHVFPGFIDPHSAIGAMGIPTRYLDNNEYTDPVTPEMNVKYAADPDEVNAQEFYKSGITTVGLTPGNSNLMGGQIVVYKTAPQKVQDRIVKEKAALKCSVTSSVKETYGSDGRFPMTKMGIFYLLESSIREAKAKQSKERNEKEKVICRAFEEKELPVFVAAQTKGEMDGLYHLLGKADVPMVFVDGFEFADDLELMLKQKTGLILGNVNNMSQIAKHHMDISKVKDLAKNGNLVAFTNTCGGYSEGREVFLWTAIEVYRAGVDAEEVVKMMTVNPAKMLKVDDRIGTLEEGKDADISIFTGHPVKTYAAKVKHSIINGEVLF